ncbi:MAG: SAM-dependent methyltransferase [archaeon]
MVQKMRFVVENFEKPSDWVLLEYRHAAKIAGKGNLLISGSGNLGKKLPTDKKHAWQLRSLPDPIILDPSAKEVLEPEDFSAGENSVVIGGICGDVPPKARTAELLTKRFPGARARSLGGLQLSIDNALWTAKRISEGRRLSEIPFVQQIELKLGKYETVKINFGYPLVQGKPLVTPGLAALLKKREEF